jgi:gas vesicle protein
MSTSKIITALFIGAAAGAIAGILLAPDKGTETRKKIAKKSSDMADDVKAKMSDLAGGVKEKVQTAADGVTNLFKKGKEKVNQWGDETDTALS